VTEADGGFRLTPQEDFVHGVSLVGTTLSFKLSGPQLIEVWLLLVLGLSVAVGLTVVSLVGSGLQLGGPLVAGMLATVAIVGYAVARSRSGVTATPGGLSLRWTIRRRELRWADIEDLRSVETPPERWAASAGVGGMGIRPRPISSWSLGLVVLCDGATVPLPTFVSASRDEGLSLGDPTATDLKIEALRRYRREVVDQ
jgi:hypothetical protein